MRLIGIAIIFVLGILAGNIMNSANLNILANHGTRACVQIETPAEKPIIKRLVFEPYGGVYLLEQLASAPDLEGVTKNTEEDFIQSFSYLNPSEVFSNLDAIQESAEYFYARLAGDRSAMSYARQHMLVYIKNDENDWFSVTVPEFC